MKLGKTHVKNTEKPTFLILKDNSILPTALSESPITSLKFHVPNEINVINNLREMLDLILQNHSKLWYPHKSDLNADITESLLKKSKNILSWVRVIEK